MDRQPDEAAFGALLEPHRRELQVHCYRMLGSFEDAEDLVQETFLRAWRNRATFERRASTRTWLYRIATNACLDALDRLPRRVMPPDVMPPADPAVIPPAPTTDVPWLQPYPDRLLETVAARDAEPDAAVVAKETIELTFIAAIQFLPPRQRAVLILRDVLGWSATQTAALLEISVAASNSVLQRSRATLKQRLPARRLDWAARADSSAADLSLLHRYIAAIERADIAGLTMLLRDDARMVMPPLAAWYDGRAAVVTAVTLGLRTLAGSAMKLLATSANRQPAVAGYVRAPGATEYVGLALNVLRIQGGHIVEITGFDPAIFGAFGFPATL